MNNFQLQKVKEIFQKNADDELAQLKLEGENARAQMYAKGLSDGIMKAYKILEGILKDKILDNIKNELEIAKVYKPIMQKMQKEIDTLKTKKSNKNKK